ncbi:MAG: hypothetical protein SNF99_09355 [Rikenellaceae bacterium]
MDGIDTDHQCGNVWFLCWWYLVLLIAFAYADLAADWWCGYFASLFCDDDDSLSVDNVLVVAFGKSLNCESVSVDNFESAPVDNL